MGTPAPMTDGGPHDAFDVLVVGAGHCGVSIATELEALGFAGSVGLISDETRHPYQRPPLSKSFMTDGDFSPTLLKPASYWDGPTADLVLDETVVSVDPSARTVGTRSGRRISYGQLVWAAGGRPRRLPLAPDDIAGVMQLRSFDDAFGLRDEVAMARKVVIIGGGYVGLESAAVLREAGLGVVLVEAAPRLLARVAGVEVSQYFLRLHRDHGVDIRLSAAVDSIDVVDGRAAAVMVKGKRLPADLIIVAVGMEPNIEPLIDAGIECQDGVLVDSVGRTSARDVWSAGDCAQFVVDEHTGARARLESVQNATEGGRRVAQALAGNEVPKLRPVPWFWSNQFDVKFKSAGWRRGEERSVVRGDIRAESFSIVYLADDAITAVDSINSVRDHVEARRLIGRRVAAAEVADASRPMADSCVDKTDLDR